MAIIPTLLFVLVATAWAVPVEGKKDSESKSHLKLGPCADKLIKPQQMALLPIGAIRKVLNLALSARLLYMNSVLLGLDS